MSPPKYRILPLKITAPALYLRRRFRVKLSPGSRVLPPTLVQRMGEGSEDKSSLVPPNTWGNARDKWISRSRAPAPGS